MKKSSAQHIKEVYGHAFDTTAVLEIGDSDPTPLPEVEDGSVVLSVSAAFRLPKVRKTELGGKHLHPGNWYDFLESISAPVQPGEYRINFHDTRGDRLALVAAAVLALLAAG